MLKEVLKCLFLELMNEVNADIELEKIKCLADTDNPNQSFSFGERACLYT